MVDTPFDSLKAKEEFIFHHFSFFEQLIFHAQLS